uniref:Uncharacterized protein n=1 Tax=Ixodes ricinus TaxID=34613 RepID=A0A6B0UC10_IXORI
MTVGRTAASAPSAWPCVAGAVVTECSRMERREKKEATSELSQRKVSSRRRCAACAISSRGRRPSTGWSKIMSACELGVRYFVYMGCCVMPL